MSTAQTKTTIQTYVLAKILRNQRLGEQHCIGRVKTMATSAYVTPEESEGFLEEMHDEARHAQMVATCMARYPDTGEDIDREIGADCRAAMRPEGDPIFDLPEGMVTERKAQMQLKINRKLFAIAGDQETVNVYDRLIADEEGHVAFHRSVWARVRNHPEIGAQLRKCYQDALKQRFHSNFYLKAVEESAQGIADDDMYCANPLEIVGLI